MNFDKINLFQLPSPCYVIDCDILKNNLKILKTNCDLLEIKPLISIKGFPLALLFQDMAPYINGLSAASLFEAQLAKCMGKEIHIHAPAYRPDEIENVLKLCDHVSFNSLSQWQQYQSILFKGHVNSSIGLRINPEYSEINVDKYDPCMPHSRFGVTIENLLHQDVTGIEGFHLHTMYDNNAETFLRMIDILIDKFGTFLPNLSWINLGGGQRLADIDFPQNPLKKRLSTLTKNFALDVYVEPCEAIVTECGYLVSTVLDIVNNHRQTAILDTSAICHMPDVLDMPYQPDIEFPVTNDCGNYIYTIAGISCLAGDIIGEYRFNSPLHVGDKIVFSEMGAYTFAKENYFNGINHPSILLYDRAHGLRIAKCFGYRDYELQYL
ncbi:MAG: carboxynorspermidine decarboxylase [Lachnospiraceae bacterium]|nr:carboxynorspermidine decarboxylase [Lachnospiraceae bacterium]